MSEMKQKWIDALRSGKYNQVKGTLKGQQPDGTIGYCCLGVFAEINGKELKVEEIYQDCDGETFVVEEGPTGIYNFCRENIPGFVVGDGISMNDDGRTFEEIADMIEKEWV